MLTSGRFWGGVAVGAIGYWLVMRYGGMRGKSA